MQPRVSVLLPVYNASAFLEASVGSILAQTFRDFELLLINDGSTDDSLKKMQRFSDPRIRIIENEKNLGLIDTLNKGIAAAKGELIARMDADDISHPERFAKQVQLMDQQPTIGVVGTFMDYVEKKKTVAHRFYEPAFARASFLFTNPIVHPSVMMRRSVLGEGEIYSHDYPHAEDYALWVSLLPRAQFQVIPEPLLSYRPHANQVSNKFYDVQKASVKKCHELIFGYLGIEAGEAEKELQLSLFLENYRKEKSYRIAVEKWLLKLREANRSKTFFDATAFENILGDWWFRVNQQLAGNGAGSFSAFKKSPLSEGFQPSLKSASRLRLRSYIHRKN